MPLQLDKDLEYLYVWSFQNSYYCNKSKDLFLKFLRNH